MDRESVPPATVLDIQGALLRLGGDEELLNDILRFFVEDAPPLFAELQAAIEAADASVARKTAHALKGLILGCGGVRAVRAAQAVEDVARTGKLSSATSHVKVLQEELATLVAAARACCK